MKAKYKQLVTSKRDIKPANMKARINLKESEKESSNIESSKKESTKIRTVDTHVEYTSATPDYAEPRHRLEHRKQSLSNIRAKFGIRIKSSPEVESRDESVASNKGHSLT